MIFSTFRPALQVLHPSKLCTANALRQIARPQLQSTTHTATPAFQSLFSTTTKLQKKSLKNVVDPRITQIRYHLNHPLTPRPLHFSRNRHLRHWTIHRAWLLFLRRRRWAEERSLERQYRSMYDACEHLRLLDDNGNRVSEAEGGGQGPDAGRLGVKGREVGRLYRGAMLKRGVWGSVPIEYARVQTDFPPRDGWNHDWTR
ncbi:hypothetical protein K504DRAFT_400530 [Pleomassaria siparia CBS 279.74]|uniref:Uncharacterized protein n=1 Tax=Pleomassaria siparia CBS 279.74 TaxID=1314801 RepID=A0A6G1KGP4_9PLEO|nr:hypothetical protein K504DRAFT_400530 [Pleomassaria siparia CBS 279.74]